MYPQCSRLSLDSVYTVQPLSQTLAMISCPLPRASCCGGPCQVPGCKHGNAQASCRGFFCKQHCQQLQRIRAHLCYAKRVGNIAKEFKYRVQEIMCRKHTDAGHWYILCEIARHAHYTEKRYYMSALHKLKKLLTSYNGRGKVHYPAYPARVVGCEAVSYMPVLVQCGGPRR